MPIIFSGKLPLFTSNPPIESTRLPMMHLEGSAAIGTFITSDFLWGVHWLREGALKIARDPRKLQVEIKPMFSSLKGTFTVEHVVGEESIEVALDTKQLFHSVVRINPSNWVDKLFYIANVYCTLMGSIQMCNTYLSLLTNDATGVNFGEMQNFSWRSDPTSGAIIFLTEQVGRPMAWSLDKGQEIFNWAKKEDKVSPVRGISKMPVMEPVGTNMQYHMQVEPASDNRLLSWVLTAQPE